MIMYYFCIHIGAFVYEGGRGWVVYVSIGFSCISVSDSISLSLCDSLFSQFLSSSLGIFVFVSLFLSLGAARERLWRWGGRTISIIVFTKNKEPSQGNYLRITTDILLKRASLFLIAPLALFCVPFIIPVPHSTHVPHTLTGRH